MGVVKRKKQRLNSVPTPEIENFARLCKDNIKIKHLNLLIYFTLFSMICYVVDFVLNIFRLIQFFNQLHYWYFGCYLAFWVISIVVTTTRSFRFYNKEWLAEKENKNDPRHYLPKVEYTSLNWFMKWLFGFVAPIPRYWDTIKYARKAKQAKRTDDDTHNIYFLAMIWEDAELLQLSQFDCFMESAPQVLLSLYIMIKDRSEFNVLSVIGLVFSVISLTWALVSYDNKICLMKGIKRGNEQSPSNDIINFQTDDAIDSIKNTNLKKSTLLFFAHLFWIVARYIAFSLFASVFGWIVWPACLAHLMPIFFWHRNENYGFMDSLRLSFLHVFAYLYPAEKEFDQKKHPRFSPIVYQTVFFCENVFLMILWSQSFIKFDEGINLDVLSIQSYPWNDWTFFVPWIGQISALFLSFVLFKFFNRA